MRAVDVEPRALEGERRSGSWQARGARLKLSELLSHEEIRAFSQRSDLAGIWAVGSTWGVILLTFAALARWPHPVTVALALVVLGGRQLAFAILMHEGSHGTLFKNKWLGRWVPDWLCGKLVWTDLERYRAHHRQHHARTGTDQDTDLSLITPFPTQRAALLRKLARDLFGLSGVKRVFGLFLMDIGVLKWTVANDTQRLPRDGRTVLDYAREGAKRLSGVLFTNALLALGLAAVGQLWIYAVWVGAYLTTLSLFLRIRALAEHACTERSADMLKNTRTTRAGWLARMTVAPFHVNYHQEHHLMPGVPFFRLPALHRLLLTRGVVPPPPGYMDVLRKVSSLEAA